MTQPLRLIRTNVVPPGGFRYFQAETKLWIKGATIDGLEKAVVGHRQANHLPVGTDIRGEIEQQICEAAGPEWCQGENTWTAKIQTAWRAVVQGTTTLVDWALQGGRRVSADEADARAAICAPCQYNRPVDCIPCNSQKLTDVVASFASEATPHSKYLKSCAICSCMLS